MRRFATLEGRKGSKSVHTATGEQIGALALELRTRILAPLRNAYREFVYPITVA
jgi:hypothetical protein